MLFSTLWQTAGAVALLICSHMIVTAETRVNLRPRPSKLAETARWLVHQSVWGVLSTTSSIQEIEGAPFGNPQSFVDGTLGHALWNDNSTGFPYFYVSELDVSQIDIQQNNTVSLTISAAGLEEACQFTDAESPLCARVTISGNMVEVVDEIEKDFAFDALFSRHPRMASWPSDHNWKIKKLVPIHLFVLDMFGGAKKLSVEDYFSVNL